MSIVVLLSTAGVVLAALGLFGAFVAWMVKRAVDWEDVKHTVKQNSANTQSNADATAHNTRAMKDLDDTLRTVSEKQMAMFFEFGSRLDTVESQIGIPRPRSPRTYDKPN